MEDKNVLAELYEIVKQNKREDYCNIIEKKVSYPYLYHLSSIRENLVDWIPMTGNEKILERNAECGALTGKLLEKASEVTSVTENAKSRDIIAARCGTQYKDKLHLYTEEQPEWRDSHRTYDIILIVGNFYRYCRELSSYKALLSEGGKLILADANRIGLKYMAGCQEEYRGGYFTGVEGYMKDEEQLLYQQGCTGRCYTRKEYEQILADAGFSQMEFYYPYPDYKFPSSIYSDQYLPKKGELCDNRRNFDKDRYQLFDERLVFDTMLAEGLFGEFSNSFLIEAGV